MTGIIIRALTRSGFVLACSLVVYWFYALLAVPLIEPSIEIVPLRPDAVAYSHASQTDQVDIRSLFPAEAWEIDERTVKTLQTGPVTLLFQDYRPHEDGRLELFPLSLVIFDKVDARDNKHQPKPRPIVLQAPGGALLQFDGKMDLGSARIGNLIGGKLIGNIVIRSPKTNAEANDGFLLRTSHVQLDRSQLWTPQSVEFWFGKHHGKGRDLLIELEPAARKADQTPSHFSFGQLSSVTLHEVERVYLEVPSNGLFRPSSSTTIGMLSTPPPGRRRATTPIEIRCQGPFRFNFAKQHASFEDHVDVLRINPTGTADQLNCHRLSVFFQQPTSNGETAAAENHPGAMSRLKPTRITAEGYPVIMRAPSAQASARAEFFSYDLGTRLIVLAGGATADLREFHAQAPQLRYTLAEDPKRLGTMWAAGPGMVRAKVSPGKPPLVARWTKEVRLQKDQGEHLLSLFAVKSQNQSAVAVDMDGLGHFSSGEMHVWLKEDATVHQPVPLETQPASNSLSQYEELPSPFANETGSRPRPRPPEAAMRIIPTKMLAKDDVRFDSPRITGATGRLEVWFRHLEQSASPQPSEGAKPGWTDRLAKLGDTSLTRYDVVGDVIQARLLIRNNRPTLDAVTLTGRARADELRFGPTQPPSLHIRGHFIELSQATGPDAQAEVLGQPPEVGPAGQIVRHAVPASIFAPGMQLVGPNVRLSRRENRIWMTSGGTMVLEDEKPAAPPAKKLAGPVNVNWTGNMNFDGSTISLERDVVVRTRHRPASGPTLHVTARVDQLNVRLSRRIDFQQPTKAKVDVRDIALVGPFLLENQSFDQAGVKQSHERMQARDLTIDRATGLVTGDGPGWLSSIRYARDLLKQPGITRPTGRQSEGHRLMNLNVSFSRDFQGNLDDQQITFADRIQAVYGPVVNWGDTISVQMALQDPSLASLLTCQALTVTNMGNNQQPELELDAAGNASVRGQATWGYFAAEGHRIRYAQAKDRFTLDGDGRQSASLRFFRQLGSEPTLWESNQISFSRSGRMRLEMDRVKTWSGTVNGVSLRGTNFSPR